MKMTRPLTFAFIVGSFLPTFLSFIRSSNNAAFHFKYALKPLVFFIVAALVTYGTLDSSMFVIGHIWQTRPF